MTIDHPESDTPVPYVPAEPKPAPVSLRMTGNLPALFAAKAKARLEFEPIVKNRTVRVQPTNSAAYEFEYATLDSVRASCDPALAKHGLDIWHVPCDAPDGARELHTFLTHADGGMVEAVIVLPSKKMTRDGEKDLTNQEHGSGLTYWERYSYVALAGVAAEHDDDGNAADGNTVMHSAPREKRREPAPPPPKQDRPAPRSEPIKPQATQRIEEPHPHAPPPEPANGAPCSKETGIKIRTVLKAIGVTNGVQANELCKQVTGGTSDTITEFQGQAFLTFLENEATRKGVVLP